MVGGYDSRKETARQRCVPPAAAAAAAGQSCIWCAVCNKCQSGNGVKHENRAEFVPTRFGCRRCGRPPPGYVRL